jgi:hypothetical protein
MENLLKKSCKDSTVRVGRPEDIAKTILFLLPNENP